MKRIILHCDLDAFFCRAEEIKNPSLENEAFIVGGDGRRGIVSTCSYKAREYGIHSGMPTFQAKMLCKDLIIIGLDFQFYELMSREFIDYVKKYTYKSNSLSEEDFEKFIEIRKILRTTEDYSVYKSAFVNAKITGIRLCIVAA